MAFCSVCGSKIEDQNFCSKCGANVRLSVANTSPASPIKRKTHGCLVVLLVFVGIFVILAIVGSLSDRDGSPSSRRQTRESDSTGNVANDRLLALSGVDQAAALAAAVQGGCHGQYAYYMGIYRKTGQGFWSVRCAGGASYAVMIEPDVVGSTRILECSALKVVAGTNCFEKLKQ